MVKLKRLLGCICSCILLYGQSGIVLSYESNERIHNVTNEFVLKTIQLKPDETMEVKINPSNSPLQVPACSTEITAAMPKNANQDQLTTVELSCQGEMAWNIYVPVDIQVFTKVLVAKRTIPANEVITQEDVNFVAYNKNRLYSGYFVNAGEVIGNEASHLIAAGAVLTKNNIKLPLLVHKNQMVDLTAQSNSIAVTMKGIAKEDGAINSVIKVFNPSSKRIIDATVTGINKVQVSV